MISDQMGDGKEDIVKDITCTKIYKMSVIVNQSSRSCIVHLNTRIHQCRNL